MSKITCGKVIKILAENNDTGEKKLFRSKYQCAKFFDKSPAMVYFALKKLNMVKNLIRENVRWNIREPTQEELVALPFSTPESEQSA